MDERENGIEIANPNDRLSTSSIELNRLNSVQLIDKQNINGTNHEKTCINNSSHTRTDININAVASHIKEKLHISNSGLLNGYNCHAECHLNLNGLEGCEDTSGDEDQLKDKSLPRMCETDEPLILHKSDDGCVTNENCCCHEQFESQNPVALCENKSECQPSESAHYPIEILNKSDISKLDDTNQQASRYCTCENREGRAETISSAEGIHYKCICKKASTTSNCAAVKDQLPKSDCICNDHVDEKGIGECSAVISCEGPIKYVGYESENQMPDIMRLIQKDLSEPYSIYTYRYFIHNWPKLCFLAMDGERCVGAIVCKLDMHKKHSKRGYIAMLAVDENYRKKKIGSNLVLKAIQAMIRDEADEVVLETEITNKPALRLYENLGFVRDKRLFRYYLNGVDALRLKLWLR